MEKINTRSNRTKYIGITLGIVTLAAISYSIYTTVQLTQARDENKSLTASLADTKKQLEKAKQPAKSTADITTPESAKQDEGVSSASTTQSTDPDSNFVALQPNGGFLASQPSVTFEWSSHKNATKYVIEIKRPGQANYPVTYTPENIVTPEAGRNYESFSLKKNLQPGDYVWRVTALKTQNGQDVAIQSTEDRNYQVR